MGTILRCSFLFLAAIVFGACTTTRGYDGPERPEAEISRVYFYSQKGVDLGDIAVDGRTKSYFDMSIDIAPGEHKVWLTYEVKEDDCDYYGCSTKTYSGKCDGRLKTEPGKKYNVRVSGFGDTVSMSAEVDEGGGYAGGGSCATTDVDYSFKPKLPK